MNAPEHTHCNIQIPFAFHYRGAILEGVEFGLKSIEVKLPPDSSVFYLLKNQMLNHISIEIEGMTIQINKLRVRCLNMKPTCYLYEMEFDSILPAEQQKISMLYEQIQNPINQAGVKLAS